MSRPAPPAQTPCNYLLAGGGGAFSSQAAEQQLEEAGYEAVPIDSYEETVAHVRQAREAVAAWDARALVPEGGSLPEPPTPSEHFVAECRPGRLDAAVFDEADGMGDALAAGMPLQGRGIEPGSTAWNVAEAQERRLVDAGGVRLPEGTPVDPEEVAETRQGVLASALQGPAPVPLPLRRPPACTDLGAMAEDVTATAIPKRVSRGADAATGTTLLRRAEVFAEERSAALEEGTRRDHGDARHARTVEGLASAARARGREERAATDAAGVPRARYESAARTYDRGVAQGLPASDLERRRKRRDELAAEAMRSPAVLRGRHALRARRRADDAVARAPAWRAWATGRASWRPRVPAWPAKRAEGASLPPIVEPDLTR